MCPRGDDVLQTERKLQRRCGIAEPRIRGVSAPQEPARRVRDYQGVRVSPGEKEEGGRGRTGGNGQGSRG